MYLRRDDGVTESGGGLHLESRVYLRRDDGVTESGGATFRVTCVFEEG